MASTSEKCNIGEALQQYIQSDDDCKNSSSAESSYKDEQEVVSISDFGFWIKNINSLLQDEQVKFIFGCFDQI